MTKLCKLERLFAILASAALPGITCIKPVGLSAQTRSSLKLSKPSDGPYESLQEDGAASTYRNARFGISFQVPANYRLIQGQGGEARGADFNIVPGDSAEYIYAKLERSTRAPVFPILAPSIAALYFGIHLDATEELCFAPLDFVRYQQKGTVVFDGTTFHWSADPFPKPSFGSIRGGRFGETYFRDYAGLVGSTCYEFHLRVASSLQESALPQFESVLATIRFSSRIPIPHANGLPETPFPIPDEILGISNFVHFEIAYPKIGSLLIPFVRPRPAAGAQLSLPLPVIPSGGAADLSQSNSVTFSYYSALADGDAATAAIVKLQRDIAQSLEQNHWSSSQQSNTDAQGLHSIYRKGGALLEFSRGTARCTMNSWCTQFDQLTITVFVPVNAPSAAQSGH